MNPLLVLVTLAALVFYAYTAVNAGATRARHKIHAPAMTGHPQVESALRIQGNTLEWLVIFLPALWIFAAYWNVYIGAGLGVIWIIGRIIYLVGYMKSPGKRAPGFGIQALATIVLLLGAIAGAVRGLMAG